MKYLIAFSGRLPAFLLLLATLAHWTRAEAQILSNGTFIPNSSCSGNNPILFTNGCVPSWSPSHGQPSLDGPRGLFGNHVAQLKVGAPGSGSTEGIYTPISIERNETYRLSFWFESLAQVSRQDQANIVFALTTGLAPNQSSPSASYELIRKSNQYNGSWYRYTRDFTFPSNWSTAQLQQLQLWIYSAQPTTVSGSGSGGYLTYVDSVRIEHICDKPNVYYQNTSYLPPETRTRGSIYVGNSVTSGPTGPVTVQYPNYSELFALGEIDLLPGFSVEGPRNDGATIFVAEVFPCAPPQTLCDCMSLTASRTSSTTLATKPPASADSPPSLFPNPSAGKIEFRPEKLAAENAGRFVVYDVAGREVKTVDIQKTDWQSGGVSLDMSSLDNGLYHYQFSTGTSSVSGRFAIQK